MYWPITRAYFFADDFIHLVSIANDGFVRFVFRPYAGHNLAIRNLVFWASARLFGLRADLFFWTVLVTHLLNVWLLFRIVRNLTGGLVLACLAASLWGTSPVHLGTLGWYSVYGQVLVATILLLLLDRLLLHARRGTAPSSRAVRGWCGLLLLGTMCFGTGIGVALAFPLVAFLVVPETCRRRSQRLLLLALPVATIGGYVGLRRLYALVEPLTLVEQVTGNPSWHRLQGALGMVPAFLGAAVDCGLRSFFFAPASYPSVTTYLVWAAVALGLAGVFWRGDSLERRTTLAMLILALSVYLLIGLGRQPEGTRTATWLALETRYHYVGTLPVVVVAALAASRLGKVDVLRSVPRVPLILAVFALGIVGRVRSGFRIDEHAQSRVQFAAVQRGIAAELAAQAVGSEVTLRNDLSRATLETLLHPVNVGQVRRFPGRAAVFVLEHPDGRLLSRSVRFVERDPAVLAWHARWPDTPLGHLLVAPRQ